MNFEIYTERARGFVQSAQTLAMREGHPQLQPGHLLKVLLDDPEGLCAGLIDRAGGQSRVALAQVEAWLAKQPKVSGNSSQPQATRELVRLFDTAEKAAEKAGDSYVTVERLLLALAVEKDTESGKALAAAGVTRIEALGLDTYGDEERFYSFRRATHRGEADYGRQISVIGLA